MEKYSKKYPLAQGLVKNIDLRCSAIIFNKAFGLRHYPLYEPF